MLLEEMFQGTSSWPTDEQVRSYHIKFSHTISRRLWKLIPRIVCRCIDVIFFRPKGHSVRNK
jgi:hypothetical protein